MAVIYMKGNVVFEVFDTEIHGLAPYTREMKAAASPPYKTGDVPRETLIQSLSDFTLEFFMHSEESPDANSELFKEGYDESMYKNSCKI